MKLTELDKELLVFVALEVPWEFVCAEFHQQYGSPELLARRLFDLCGAELTSLRAAVASDYPVSLQALAADAKANACYERLDVTRVPRWYLVTTDEGFERVKDRLDPD